MLIQTNSFSLTSDLYPASAADQPVVLRCSQQQIDSVEGRLRDRLTDRRPGPEGAADRQQLQTQAEDR